MLKVKIKLFYKNGKNNEVKDILYNIHIDKKDIKNINPIIKKRYLDIIAEENNLKNCIITNFIIDKDGIKEVEDKEVKKSLEEMNDKELQYYVVSNGLTGVGGYLKYSADEIRKQIKDAITVKKKKLDSEKFNNSPLKKLDEKEVEEIKRIVMEEVKSEINDKFRADIEEEKSKILSDFKKELDAEKQKFISSPKENV